jgi:hypothetical protein
VERLIDSALRKSKIGSIEPMPLPARIRYRWPPYRFVLGLEAAERRDRPKVSSLVTTMPVFPSAIASEAKQSRAGEPEPTQIASSLRSSQ